MEREDRPERGELWAQFPGFLIESNEKNLVVVSSYAYKFSSVLQGSEEVSLMNFFSFQYIFVVELKRPVALEHRLADQDKLFSYVSVEISVKAK